MKKLSYLLIGDPFLTDTQADEIIRKIHKEQGPDLPVQTFHLEDTTLASVLTQARTLPFLTEAQIFRIKSADRLKKDDVETLQTYYENPSQSTYLIFEAETVDKKSGLASLLSEHGEAMILDDRDKETAGERLIREKLRSFNKTISPPAKNRLLESMGEEPSLIQSVLDQLIAFADDKSEISEEMVAHFETKVGSPDSFALPNALGNENVASALGVLRQLLDESNGDVIGLVGLLHWQLRRLWQGRVLFDEKSPEGILLKKCSVSPRQAPYFMRQVRRFTRARLERALEGLFQLDWKLKTGRTAGPVALESWVAELCGK